ncbi:MAG: hypothetical protein WA126_04645 [Thermodesulfovibrionales bacterium]
MRKALFIAILMIMMVSFAEADTILLPGSTWEYTFTDPTGAGGWQTGLAPFGNRIGPYGPDIAGYFSYNTLWEADGNDGDDLWVRRALDLTGYDLSTIAWNLGVDNGFKLYVNSNLVYGDNAEGYTHRWEYGGSIPQAFLQPGNNVIAVALEDHGGLTAFDMQITGNQSSVPEPSTILLLV